MVTAKTHTDDPVAIGNHTVYPGDVIDVLGTAFPHDAYLSDLTTLRDQLKAGLSGASPEQGGEGADRS